MKATKRRKREGVGRTGEGKSEHYKHGQMREATSAGGCKQKEKDAEVNKRERNERRETRAGGGGGGLGAVESKGEKGGESNGEGRE